MPSASLEAVAHFDLLKDAVLDSHTPDQGFSVVVGVDDVCQSVLLGALALLDGRERLICLPEVRITSVLIE